MAVCGAHHKQRCRVRENLPSRTHGLYNLLHESWNSRFCVVWHFTGHIQVSTLMRRKAHKPKVSSRAWFWKGQRIVNYILLNAVMFLPTWNYRPFYWMNNNSSEINLIWLRQWKWFCFFPNKIWIIQNSMKLFMSHLNVKC